MKRFDSPGTVVFALLFIGFVAYAIKSDGDRYRFPRVFEPIDAGQVTDVRLYIGDGRKMFVVPPDERGTLLDLLRARRPGPFGRGDTGPTLAEVDIDAGPSGRFRLTFRAWPNDARLVWGELDGTVGGKTHSFAGYEGSDVVLWIERYLTRLIDTAPPAAETTPAV